MTFAKTVPRVPPTHATRIANTERAECPRLPDQNASRKATRTAGGARHKDPQRFGVLDSIFQRDRRDGLGGWDRSRVMLQAVGRSLVAGGPFAWRAALGGDPECVRIENWTKRTE